jgi:hypothetical protein
VIVNGGIVNFGEDLVLPERGELEIGLYVGQSKNEDSFKETPIDRLKSRLEILLRHSAAVKLGRGTIGPVVVLRQET